MSKVPEETCRHIIISSNDGVMEAISELCRNLLHNNIPVADDFKKQLEPHAGVIRKIARKKLKTKSKRKLILNQNGGLSFLPSLLAALIPTVLSLFNIKT